MSRDGRAALFRGAMGLSAVCDCGISSSYSLTIFEPSVENQMSLVRLNLDMYLYPLSKTVFMKTK